MTQRAEFSVQGMDCAEEVATLKAELAPLAGVEALSFEVMNRKLIVEYDEVVIQPGALVSAVARTGMKAEPWKNDGSAGEEAAGLWSRWGRTVTTAVSGVALLAGFSFIWIAQGWRAAIGGSETAMPWGAKACFLVAIVAGSWHVLPKALRALVRFRPDMNLLMTVAIVGALVLGEYFEAATVAFLFALSLALESWSVARARRAVAALMSLSPDLATVVGADGRETVTEVNAVAVGSTIVIRPGEKVPLDGTVSKGESSVNQAPITGESTPVPKTVGSEVYAGTINDDGALEVVTSKLAQDTTLAQIIRMVGDAQRKRSPSEQWVETFARFYTPAVMVLALGVIVVPPLVFGGSWQKWFYEGLVLLVIACPCALVISTPVSIVAALAAAARRGVLVKGGLSIEVPRNLVAIAVDKTGTLTEGRPAVREVVPLSGHDERELLEIAASIEIRSEHPLAKAIVREALRQGIQPAAAGDYQAIKGKGATAVLDGRPVWVGSHRLAEERGQETPEIHDRLTSLESQGASVVVIGEDRHVCGMIALTDRVRDDAKLAVSQLKAAGIRHVVMLTGDNLATAEAVARETGVDEARAGLLPQDKVAAIEELVHRYGQVAMVGDGVNDAPAMARSTLGIAMGAMGTDAALETADVALMNDSLLGVAWLMRHSRRTVAIIRQNIFFSLGVKAVFVILTLSGSASLWAAIAADAGASLLVLMNGLRLLDPRD
jgi:Zn2+/Cd2+-exporting ATPase